ncbi:PREDICTED: uncharacterized protein LOC109189546 [Ipomoea nil]|uniref:uncharacterized protein LOC109189546 n=1 Tax=Ipomoea nil TaxID=35883 RepID=UPI000901354D|nr:PREDICTED: uncharacterized protein LOC109189546 [Ipomoea nil]
MAWLLDGGCRDVVEEAWGRGVEVCSPVCRGVALADFRRLKAELVKLEKQEDVFWRQRAKQHWLRGADANTRFYHRYASARKRKNTILRLKDDLGRWVDGDAMKPVVMSYFNEIFTANPGVNDGAEFFASVPTRVTQTHNDWLNRPYDPGEKFWDIVGADVTDFVLECLNTGSLPVGLNESNVVLIPKTQSPEVVTDLRPIALSNVVYKVIANVIANRMKPLLGDVIFVSQSAFIPGRLITDNILVAAEVRGLSLLLQQAQDRGVVHGLRVARGAPAFSHLFFADDSLLFFNANVNEAQAIKRCLTFYEDLSGQTINYHKSNICFSRNTQLTDRDLVAAVFGVQQAVNFGKYLGLPAYVERNKHAVFAYVEDKVRQRIGSWNKKLLSRAGKEILLKSVAQAMPTFTMSVFLLPDSLCKNLERVMNRFWWRNGKDGGGIHWLAWDKLSIPEEIWWDGFQGFEGVQCGNARQAGVEASD